jgi:Tol biopolymer transport system component
MLTRRVVIGSTIALAGLASVFTSCERPVSDADLSFAYVTTLNGGDQDIYGFRNSDTVDLTRNEARDEQPAWSADAGWIAFVSDKSGNPEIYTMRRDGSNKKRLTSDPATDGGPTWAPDGKHLAFHSDRSGKFQIYVMRSDGSEVRRISQDAAVNDQFPSWSSDGQRIAFESDRAGGSAILVMSADGSGERRLTGDDGSYRSPAWSPDGTRIAYVSGRDSLAEIYVMDADGSNQLRITNNAADDEQPAWGVVLPDHLDFATNRRGDWDIYGVTIGETTDRPEFAYPGSDETDPARPIPALRR